jgi:FtsP/CotA-like multicopper oxidase with cupredoxin domain
MSKPTAQNASPAEGTTPSTASSRRKMLKLGATAVPAGLLGASSVAHAQSLFGGLLGGVLSPLQAILNTLTNTNFMPESPAASTPSPTLTPFMEPLQIIKELPARPLTDAAFAHAPTIAPNRAINPATGIPFEGRGDRHQLRELNPPQVFFAQRFGAVPPVSIHPQLRPQVNFWGSNFGGELSTDAPTTPMPTIVSRYKAGANTAILVRRFNNLPDGPPSGGFGRNEMSTHLHNFHSAPDSDGGPCDPALGALSHDPRTQGRFFFRGQYYDYYYNMKRSGFTKPGTPDGDVRETLGTLWYHDHMEAHTAENVYKGIAGFHLVFNEYDTGDETQGFRLPSYPKYDIPLIFADLRIDPATEQATFDVADDNGHLGDKYLVNGKIQPYFEVERRRYRFRLLNEGPSRFYEFFLTNPDNPTQRIPFWQIANDGNLLPKPLQVFSSRQSVAERADVIFDFNKLTAPGGPAAGATRLWLENRLIQTSGRGPSKEYDPAGTPRNALIEFRLGAITADASVDPAQITSFAPITLPPLPRAADITVTRTLAWGRSNGGWVVNGKPINCDEIRFTMKRDRWERWIFKTGGGWAHPIHNHFVEGRLISRNGVAIGPNSPEFGRKDVIWLGDGDECEYWVKATDYVGVYPMHCHNSVHEDKGMMLLFRVNDVGDTNDMP